LKGFKAFEQNLVVIDNTSTDGAPLTRDLPEKDCCCGFFNKSHKKQ